MRLMRAATNRPNSTQPVACAITYQTPVMPYSYTRVVVPTTAAPPIQAAIQRQAMVTGPRRRPAT